MIVSGIGAMLTSGATSKLTWTDGNCAHVGAEREAMSARKMVVRARYDPNNIGLYGRRVVGSMQIVKGSDCGVLMVE